MKKFLFLFALAISVHAYAESPPVETFRAGLRAFQANGPDALLGTWYNADTTTDRSALRSRLASLTATLGSVVETEAFIPKMLGKRVTRLYGVIYFQKRPLWIRADYYTADGDGGFISLEFSLKPEEILPLEISVK